MNELSLFTGAGGGLLGSLLLGWRTVCGVEIDPYCQRLLMQRQDDGILPPFPIWPDIRTFDGSPFYGAVDIVSGGFPCQPFSTASHGQRVAVDLWPEMLRVVREVRPRFVFAENVQRSAIQRAAEELAELDYVVRCARVSAASVGAPHRRERFWLLADAYYETEPAVPVNEKMARLSETRDPMWGPKPPVQFLGVDDRLAARVDAMRAIGNGQVPSVVVLAWRILAEGREF